MKKAVNLIKIYSESKKVKIILKVLFFCLWAAIIALCFLNRGKITVDEIIRITPHNTVLAVVLVLVMFALKSLTVVIYCGILYVACGIMFPFPISVAVNFVGTAIMVSIPFFIGRHAGAETLEKIVSKYPKAAEIRLLREGNDFFTAFFIRIIGLLPSDPISTYMGAIGLDYKKYLAGTLLGMLPSIVAFPLIGMSFANPASPIFICAVVFELSVSVIALSLHALIKKKKAVKAAENEK